ncbi:MAG: selenocysteine-specific translation elongation factor [Chloroflexi bacterium]|nr:selenocysteine-specific translation elongation factor [Chloroflexota bacterium]
MHVIGTAGHVDHGKSTLVRAMTGIDPDRLQEEKERGMTIDLGFAWLRLPSGREISIVDVPGHERFIKNMLAGVGGIDLALLVIAADEGVMPQTREHLAILDLLRVKSGTAVITKKDLVDEEWLELVVSDVQDVLKDTHLRASPIVSVSSTTGEGLADLLATIDRLLEATPPKKDIGRPRLPVDRVFTIAGFGTVVTGTLIDGSLSVGQEIEVLPRRLKSRIRGLQTHKHKVEAASPGNRVAVNIANLSTTDLSRGDVIASMGWLVPTTAVDVELRLVPDLKHVLHHNAQVTFHTGASEVTGVVRLLERGELGPGETSWAQIKLSQPVSVVKGDFFIIRSPDDTLGGGEVVDSHARRHRRYNDATLDSLSLLQKGTPADILLTALRRIEPAEVRTVLEGGGLPKAEAASALLEIVKDGRALVLPASPAEMPSPTAFVVSGSGWSELKGKVASHMEAYHRQFPLRSGMAKEELKSRLKFSSRLFGDALARLISEGAVVEGETSVRAPGHAVRVSPAQQAILDRFLDSVEANPYSPPGDNLPEPELLSLLVEQGKIVKVDEGVFFAASAYRDMTDKIVATIKTSGKVTVGEVRDTFHTSRKYALAFLEHLDEKRITRRVGDDRVLR